MTQSLMENKNLITQAMLLISVIIDTQSSQPSILLDKPSLQQTVACVQLWSRRPTFLSSPWRTLPSVVPQWLALTLIIFSCSFILFKHFFAGSKISTSQRLYILQTSAARFAFVVRSWSRMEHIVVIMSSGSSPAAKSRRKAHNRLVRGEGGEKSRSGYYALFKSTLVLSVSYTHTAQNFYINKWMLTRTPCRNTYKSSKCTAHIHGQLMLI